MKYHAPVLKALDTEVRELLACSCLCTLAAGAGGGYILAS